MNRTRKAAELMLGKGWFTSATLGEAMGISAREASGLLFNIRNSSIYEIEETPLPGRKIKVVSVAGRSQSVSSLWNKMLFGGKAA